DIESVNVARNNVSVLAEQVRATQDRFDLGEVTRTDVSLSEARLAAARSNEALVLGSLAISRENFLAAVGRPAGTPQPPPVLPELPATLAQAEAIAMREQPELNAARFNQIAAEFDLTRARAARGPTVSLGADVTYSDTPGNAFTSGRSRDTSAGLSVTGNLPIYQGGQLSALVRQAEANLAQSQFDVQNTARAVRQNLGSAWSNLAVARATITANQQEVRAATVAFEGGREEASLGARTTLDVLDLEQDLRDAEFALASSLRDEYVAAYQLLSAMGLLTVKHLNLGIPTYDPDVNFNRVQNGPYSTVEGSILDKLRDRYSR
ncbi:MAG: TolC family protein, partial [Pseudomonadota bacterium]